MPFTDFKDIAGGIKDCIEAVGMVVGGGWALWRFVIKGESHPQIQVDLDLRVVSRDHDHLVVDVVAVVENKGLVRHWLRDFKPRTFPLSDGDPAKARGVPRAGGFETVAAS